MQANINKIDLAAPSLVIKKRKSPIGSLLWMVGGLIIAFSKQFIPAIGNSADLNSGVVIVGWSCFIFGLTMLVIKLFGANSFDYYYAPTKEKMQLKTRFYDVQYKDKISDLAQKGAFDKIAGLPISTISSVKLAYYTTAGGEVKWSQVFEFVPHVHVPVTEVIAYDSCKLPKGME